MLATLCSATSSRVVKGELLRLCPGLNRMSTLLGKSKTDCHDVARAGQLFGGIKSLEVFPHFAKDRYFRSHADSTLVHIPGAAPMFYYKTPMAKRGRTSRIVWLPGSLR